MSDIYTDMAKVAQDLLAPTSQGGLGQGTIVLKRIIPGTPDHAQPWVPVAPQTITQTLRGAARGVSMRLVGSEVGGTIILASDRVATTEAPTIEYKAGDQMVVDGKAVQVLSVEKIPAAGTTVAVKWIIR